LLFLLNIALQLSDDPSLATGTCDAFKPWKFVLSAEKVRTCKGNIHKVSWPLPRICTMTQQLGSFVCGSRPMGGGQKLFWECSTLEPFSRCCKVELDESRDCV